MTQEGYRFVDRLDDCGDVLELPFRFVLLGVTAIATPASVDCVDSSVLGEGGADIGEVPRSAIERTAVDEFERRTTSDRSYAISVPSADVTVPVWVDPPFVSVCFRVSRGTRTTE